MVCTQIKSVQCDSQKTGIAAITYYYAQRPSLIVMRGVTLNVPVFTYAYTAEIKSSYLSI